MVGSPSKLPQRQRQRRATEGICVKTVCPQLPQPPHGGVPSQAAGAGAQQGVETSFFLGLGIWDTGRTWSLHLKKIGLEMLWLILIVSHIQMGLIRLCLCIISPCFAISLLEFRLFNPHSWRLQVHFNPFQRRSFIAMPCNTIPRIQQRVLHWYGYRFPRGLFFRFPGFFFRPPDPLQMHKPPTTNLPKACWLLAGLFARWMACLLAPWLACSILCCLACLLSCLLLGWLTCLLASWLPR